MARRASLLYWAGPSRFTGDPVNVFIRAPWNKSQNRKLGNVFPVVIAPAAELPSESRRTGLDEAVCGTCPLRPLNGGGCYVHMFPGPDSTAYAHRREPFTTAGDIGELYGGRVVRVSEWGDPAAVPLYAWEVLRRHATVLAYTHEWRHLDVKAWGWCMASVSTVEDMMEATRRGWRTYRARPPGSPVASGAVREVQCPAAEEATGHGRVTCETCRICTGTAGRSTRPVSIEAHGQARRKVHLAAK